MSRQSPVTRPNEVIGGKMADFAHGPVLTITPDDDLYTALKRLTELNVDGLPVASSRSTTRRGGWSCSTGRCAGGSVHAGG